MSTSKDTLSARSFARLSASIQSRLGLWFRTVLCAKEKGKKRVKEVVNTELCGSFKKKTPLFGEDFQFD